MKKIIVIGPSGAGKSSFSRKLGNILNINVYHLDNLFWREDKSHISKDEFDNKLNNVLINDSWIIDGDYSRTYEIRMKSCDTIFFLDYSLDVCLNGVKERIGKKRVDIPWVEDEFDPEFREWIENWYINTFPITNELLNKYKNEKEIIIFKNREEANKYLELLNKGN